MYEQRWLCKLFVSVICSTTAHRMPMDRYYKYENFDVLSVRCSTIWSNTSASSPWVRNHWPTVLVFAPYMFAHSHTTSTIDQMSKKSRLCVPNLRVALKWLSPDLCTTAGSFVSMIPSFPSQSCKTVRLYEVAAFSVSTYRDCGTQILRYDLRLTVAPSTTPALSFFRLLRAIISRNVGLLGNLWATTHSESLTV